MSTFQDLVSKGHKPLAYEISSNLPVTVTKIIEIDSINSTAKVEGSLLDENFQEVETNEKVFDVKIPGKKLKDKPENWTY